MKQSGILFGILFLAFFASYSFAAAYPLMTSQTSVTQNVTIAASTFNQTFTVPTGYANVKNITLNLSTGNAAVNANVTILLKTASGTVLGTSPNQTIMSATYALYNFTFTTPVNVTAGTTYNITGTTNATIYSAYNSTTQAFYLVYQADLYGPTLTMTCGRQDLSYGEQPVPSWSESDWDSAYSYNPTYYYQITNMNNGLVSTYNRRNCKTIISWFGILSSLSLG